MSFYVCVCVMRDERWVKGDTLIEKFAQNEKKDRRVVTKQWLKRILRLMSVCILRLILRKV